MFCRGFSGCCRTCTICVSCKLRSTLAGGAHLHLSSGHVAAATGLWLAGWTVPCSVPCLGNRRRRSPHTEAATPANRPVGRRNCPGRPDQGTDGLLPTGRADLNPCPTCCPLYRGLTDSLIIAATVSGRVSVWTSRAIISLATTLKRAIRRQWLMFERAN